MADIEMELQAVLKQMVDRHKLVAVLEALAAICTDRSCVALRPSTAQVAIDWRVVGAGLRDLSRGPAVTRLTARGAG